MFRDIVLFYILWLVSLSFLGTVLFIILYWWFCYSDLGGMIYVWCVKVGYYLFVRVGDKEMICRGGEGFKVVLKEEGVLIR